MNNLKITSFQVKLAWEDKDKNLDLFSKLIDDIGQKTDLVVLPEMFTTGFSMNPEGLAETMEGKTMQWLSSKAKLRNAVITGSFIAEDQGAYFNRLVWMKPDGSFQTYDKKHLFTLAGEHHSYTAGKELLYVDLKGWKVCPLICYDLRFPVWSRNTVDYDLLIYVANWPERRGAAWRTLLTARAIENQAYVLGVNRVGEDGNGHYYSGDSMLVDYAGNVFYHSAHVENQITLTIDKALMYKFREKLAFLKDRDRFRLT